MGHVENPAVSEALAQSIGMEVGDAITLVETGIVAAVVIGAAVVAVGGIRNRIRPKAESE